MTIYYIRGVVDIPIDVLRPLNHLDGVKQAQIKIRKALNARFPGGALDILDITSEIERKSPLEGWYMLPKNN
jgi:hypothetical protein